MWLEFPTVFLVELQKSHNFSHGWTSLAKFVLNVIISLNFGETCLLMKHHIRTSSLNN